MIVYNITSKIERAIEIDWVRWQQEEHIPAVMASGFFTGCKFYRLLEQDDEEAVTYVVQYFADSLENYQRHIQETAPLLRQRVIDRWGEKMISFRTIMELVN